MIYFSRFDIQKKIILLTICVTVDKINKFQKEYLIFSGKATWIVADMEVKNGLQMVLLGQFGREIVFWSPEFYQLKFMDEV